MYECGNARLIEAAKSSSHSRKAKKRKRKTLATDMAIPGHAGEIKVKKSRRKRKKRSAQQESEYRQLGDSSNNLEGPNSGHTGEIKVKKSRRKRKKGSAQLESEFRKSGDSSNNLEGARKLSTTSQYVVPVSRPEDVEKSRENLPIVMMEQEIMEAIQENPVVLVCGETGCGKTTQVPQFLYEAGYGSALSLERAGMIGVTQPRRVAVLATARRVAHELSVNLGQQVGFQIRHDRRIGEKCCIKFMTDGILLRELQDDFVLRKYSVIVLDEAHERSLNTDILIGMLSRIIPLRQKLFEQHCARQKNSESDNGKTGAQSCDGVTPLKLVIMSATLRVEDFTSNRRMFSSPPPVLRVPARQYPVTLHFNKKTELLDYVGAAYKKVCTIHRKLPPGGILVFVTGQREVEDLCRKLRKSYQQRRNARDYNDYFCDDKGDVELESTHMDGGFGGLSLEAISAAADEDVRDDCVSSTEQSSEHSNDDSDSDEDMDGERVLIGENALQKLQRTLYPDLKNLTTDPASRSGRFSPASQDEADSNIAGQKMIPDSRETLTAKVADTRTLGPLHVLPLYAMLPAAAQLRVFSHVPKGTRLVVVATNVAETSITIPDIRYVVDCGRAKERHFDQSSGISRYEVEWISKASADQRAGRAGRTGPGHCYRLYSSAHFNNTFPQFALPEISKATIEGVVLVMKTMGIDKVANFPFPSPPDNSAVAEAERCLTSLSALSPRTGVLTSLGRAMAAFPISPRHSRMLLAAIKELALMTTQKSISALALAYALAVAAVLSLEDPFLREESVVEEGEEHDCITGDNTKTSSITSDKHLFAQAEINPKDSESVRRRLRSKALAAQAEFKNLTSDALSIANALRAYDHAEDPEKFCQDHFIHAKRMHEMSQLRKQLWNLVLIHSGSSFVSQAGIFGDSSKIRESYKIPLDDSEKCWNSPLDVKLSSMEEDLVGQAVCAGWPDKVARRLSKEEQARLPKEWNRRKLPTYKSCSTDQLVLLHSSSSLSRVAPTFVVYNELVSSSETYMRGITRVDSKWLAKQAEALCVFSKPLPHPLPCYDSQRDEVNCWVLPTFGRHLWDLPICTVPMKKGKHRTAVFAASLLQGKVLPSLSILSSCLTNDPVILLRPESQALKRVSELTYRLGESVDSRARLGAVWNTDRYFLYSEILSWILPDHQAKLKKVWERLIMEAQLTGQE